MPRLVGPSMNVTFPVGVPVAGETGATVAVKVIVCPETLGLADDRTEVVLLVVPTIC